MALPFPQSMTFAAAFALAACATEMIDRVVPSVEERNDWYQIQSGHIQLGGRFFGFALQLYPGTHLSSGLPSGPLIISLDVAVLSEDRFELDPTQTTLQIGTQTYSGRGETCSVSGSRGSEPLLQPKVLAKRDCVRLVFDAPNPHQWKHAQLTISGLKRNAVALEVPIINLELKKVPKPGSFV